MYKILLSGLFILSSFALTAAERVKWEQSKEISVELKIDAERKIVFPEQVRFGFKPRYAELFKQSIIDNVFYLTPKQSFNEKLAFQGLASGRFYILQAVVTADATKASDELVIHLQSESSDSANLAASQSSGGVNQAVKLTPIDLVQFASQSLYAPSKALIEPKGSIKRVAIKQRAIPNMYRGGNLQGQVVASWVGGGMYVTAVKLTNISVTPITFEPCRVRGDFYSATAQFKTAYKAGHANDFTMVYLLSEKPFDAAIQSRELLCV